MAGHVVVSKQRYGAREVLETRLSLGQNREEIESDMETGGERIESSGGDRRRQDRIQRGDKGKRCTKKLSQQRGDEGKKGKEMRESYTDILHE